jgi:hypothetical protein
MVGPMLHRHSAQRGLMELGRSDQNRVVDMLGQTEHPVGTGSIPNAAQQLQNPRFTHVNLRLDG